MMIKNRFIKIIFTFACIYSILFISCNSKSSSLFKDANNNFKLGNYEVAIDLLNKLSKNERLNFDEYKLRALAYNKLKKYQLAIGDFKECLKIQSDKKILTEIAQCYLLGNNLDSAKKYFEYSIKIDSNNWEALNGRGICFLKSNELDLASMDFRNALKLNPDFYMIYNNIGLINENKRNYNEAIRNYNLAIQKNKVDDRVFFNRGVSYMYLNKTDKALIDYNMALKLNPNESNYYLNRGMAYYLLKRYAEACSDWQKSSKMNNKEAEEYQRKYCYK